MSEIKNILITGATGFIGKHLLDDFKNENVLLYVLSRNENIAIKQKNVRVLIGDIFELHKFSEQLAILNFIIHIAGEKRNEELMYSVNVEGTKSMLNAIEKYSQIKILHVSSSGVYGIENHPDIILAETCLCYPNNTYEKTKYEAENILASAAKQSKINYTIIRPSNIFGENDSSKKLLTLFNILKQNKFFYINRNAIVNYVYVKHVSEVIKEIILKNLFQNKIYNVNAPTNIVNFIEMIKNAMGIDRKTTKIPSFLSWGIKLLAKAAAILPKRFQVINTGKYRELTSTKYYSTKEIKKIISINENQMLNTGIHNLVDYYKSEKLL